VIAVAMLLVMARALHPRVCFCVILVYSLLASFSSVYHYQGAVTESVLLSSADVVQNKEAATTVVESQVIAPNTSPVVTTLNKDETEESETEPEKVSSKSKSATNVVEWQEPEVTKTVSGVPKYVKPFSIPGATDDMPDGSSTFSSCLMVMDDNHRLVEWIAYHYFVMNLRYLVILPDELSRYSPKSILDKWRKYMVIEEWKDEHFMDEDHKKRASSFLATRDTRSRENKQQYHKERQANYYRYCALHMQAMNRTWVSFHDVDEYYVINSEVVKNATGRMREPGSVLKVLNQVQSIVQPLFELTNISVSEHYMTPCVTTYRQLYGAVESTETERRRGVPAFVDPKRFETLRWRHCASPKVPPQIGKSLLDVSKIPDLENKHYVERPFLPFSTHRILPMCSYPFKHENAFIRVNHYIGSWEYYSFRTNDVRKGGKKNRDTWEKESAVQGGTSGDEIRPWMDGFVLVFGEKESIYLLEGSGLDENYTAAIDPSWVLPDDRRKRLKLTDKI
jgi:hypothetical protein